MILEMRKYVTLFLLFGAVMLFVVSMWELDWFIWHPNGGYVYYPLPGYFHVRFEQGFIINVTYYQMLLTFMAALVLAFAFGSNKTSSVR